MEILRKAKIIIETNSFFSSAFDLLAGTWFYRKIIEAQISRYQRKIKADREYNVIIETTNLCNARCIMCPHVKMKRRKQVMEDKVFEKILSRLKEEKINPLAFIINGFGDPLTDKKIFSRIALLRKSFPESVIKFYTNFNLAEDKAIAGVLNCGLDEINISFNGGTPESYKQVMGLEYSKTVANLEKLIKERNHQKSLLKIRLSMALVAPNENTADAFRQKWEKVVDSVSINKTHSYGGAVKDVAGESKINFNKKSYPCKYLWNTLVFSVTGEIVLCCLDYEGQYSFGSISDNKILTMFYSPAFELIRRKHLENKIKDLPLCSRCYTPYRNGVEWLVKDLY